EFSAQDGHAICADYVDATEDCELADGDIIVYEDMVTRVFNFVGAFGDFGVYVFNDATGDPIEGASVCAYDEGFNAVACGETGAEGNVGFNLPTGTYLVSASAPGFESQAAVCEYDAIVDAPVDCTIGLEPGGASLIVTAVGPFPGLQGENGSGVEGVVVGPFVPDPNAGDETNAEPFDACVSGDQVAVGTTNENGEVAFGIDPDATYCVYAFGNSAEDAEAI